MIYRRYRALLSTGFIIIVSMLLHPAQAQDAAQVIQNRLPPTPGQSAQIIKNFLLSRVPHQEYEVPEAQDKGFADFNNDGWREIVLVWSGEHDGTWHTLLSVLSYEDKVFKHKGTRLLGGESRITAIKNGVIYTDEASYRPNDLDCCPSGRRKGRYRWTGSNVIELDNTSQNRNTPAL